MSIPWGQLRSLTARQIVAALRRDGFALVRQTGSHQQYIHPDDLRLVTVSFHRPGQTFRIDNPAADATRPSPMDGRRPAAAGPVAVAVAR